MAKKKKIIRTGKRKQAQQESAVPAKSRDYSGPTQGLKNGVNHITYGAEDYRLDAITLVTNAFVEGRNVQTTPYNYLNGRTPFEAIDDWTKRWNGHLVNNNPLIEEWQSNIFLNFTRNQVISYLSKVAVNPVKAKIKAVHGKYNIRNKTIEEALKTMKAWSEDEENSPSKFMAASLECTIKGTVFTYETYGKFIQKNRCPIEFDPTTGNGSFEELDEIVFENCFQKLIPFEELYYPNMFTNDIQTQAWILWRQTTDAPQAALEFQHYRDWDMVVPGAYQLTNNPQTFFREDMSISLANNEVETLRFYSKAQDRHIIVCNGIVLYDGPMPFKHKKYPFARGIFEPFGNDFMMGCAFPQKIMGDQDLVNTVWNLMADKEFVSAFPPTLSSDFDDLIDDDTLEPAKIRQVSDVEKWKVLPIAGINSGDIQMLSQAVKFVNDNSGNPEGGANTFTPNGGKVPVRQAIMAQEEAMKKIGFPMFFLEDYERDRSELRVKNLIQFMSIPRIDELTDGEGKLVKSLVYRSDIMAENQDLSNGKRGVRVIKLTDSASLKDPNQMEAIKSELDTIEHIGEQTGQQTEALAVAVDIFKEYKLSVQIVRNSSYEQSRAIDQAFRQEYAQWRLSVAPELTNKAELMAWVDESFDVPSDRFTIQPQMGGPQMLGPGGPAAGGQPGAGQPTPIPNPLQ